MTIVEFLKLKEEATILNLRKSQRWLYWDIYIKQWVVKEHVKDIELEPLTLIETFDEEKAIKMLMEGK